MKTLISSFRLVRFHLRTLFFVFTACLLLVVIMLIMAWFMLPHYLSQPPV